MSMKQMNRRLRVAHEEKLKRDELTAMSRQQPWMSLRDLLDVPYPIGDGKYVDPKTNTIVKAKSALYEV